MRNNLTKLEQEQSFCWEGEVPLKGSSLADYLHTPTRSLQSSSASLHPCVYPTALEAAISKGHPQSPTSSTRTERRRTQLGSCSRKPSRALQKGSPPGMGQGHKVHRASTVWRDSRVGSHGGKGQGKPGLKQGSRAKLEGDEWGQGGRLCYR